jgi:putative FmdB family regulatory protein
MPIYEYKCKKCGHTFGVLQPATAGRTGAVCPQCGGSETERVISRFSSAVDGKSCGSRGPFT